MWKIKLINLILRIVSKAILIRITFIVSNSYIWSERAYITFFYEGGGSR